MDDGGEAGWRLFDVRSDTIEQSRRQAVRE
jgi:hypothetical protein